MWSLFRKEISSFLSSIIGYLVILVFLLITSLFLWVFDGEFNILNAGYATLDPLFIIAPFVFLFLIPAITMRMFADEHKAGTMELLATRPISDLSIVLAKFLAGWALVALALVPTLLYYYTVSSLGAPVGNIDSGGTMGSYIGLLLLAGAYVSIGLFASSLTSNQIVAFIVALFLSFLLYLGLDNLASWSLLGPADHLVEQLGMSSHYVSMSRGVLDSRDVLYFFSLMAAFTAGCITVLQSRKW